MVRYCLNRSFFSRFFWPSSVPLEKLPLRLSVLNALSVSARLSCGRWPIAKRTGDDAAEEDVLPNRRWVESVIRSSSSPLLSHHGQLSLRVSHPSRRSFEGQLERLCSSLHARRSSYHRWRQAWVETFRPATHMAACDGVI